MSANLRHALDYAVRGWRVFPVYEALGGRCACARGAECDRPGKHPRIPGGVNAASSTEAQIRSWWGSWPAASIGIATGSASGLTVIDADAGDGKPGVINLTRFCIEHGGVPATMRVETGGGGLHLYFRYSDALRTGVNVLDEAIDVRNDGGYVIAPPSAHVSGRSYSLANGVTDLLALPDWMRPATRQRRARRAARRENITLEHATQMLAHVDPDDRDRWLKVGLIVGRMYVGTPAESEAWAMYEAWSARSAKFDSDRGANLVRMRDMFYTESQAAPRAGGEALGAGTLYLWAQEGGYETPTQAKDTDHSGLADAVLEATKSETGAQLVFSMGSFWRAAECLWIEASADELASEIGRRYRGGKLCRRVGDYNSIARLAATRSNADTFFQDAPVGIAGPSGFWKVDESGAIQCEPLTADHRQRMCLKADPVLNGRPARLLRMLADAFDGHDPEGQTRLLQQLTGCALTRSLWRHRIVALLYGATSSGKSTYLNVLRAAFPRDQLAATSPARWANEYYVATLAGKALNIVGELDGGEPIPSGAFKAITGRDLVDGRHPTHRPFSFVCEAAHFFNSNRTPPTTDRDDAFFRRWRILHFANAVPAEREQRNLDERIVAEEFGEFLGWALEGASEVARTGAIVETAPHTLALARWRVGNNSALEFLLDPEHCAVEREASAAGQALFDRYKGWAAAAGLRRPFGRSGFYEAIERGGAVADVRLARRDHQVVVDGVRLKLEAF